MNRKASPAAVIAVGMVMTMSMCATRSPHAATRMSLDGQGIAARILNGVLPAAEASEIALGAGRGPAVGSCSIPLSDSDGIRLIKAAGPGEGGDPATEAAATTAATGGVQGGAKVLAGGCSVAVTAATQTPVPAAVTTQNGAEPKPAEAVATGAQAVEARAVAVAAPRARPKRNRVPVGANKVWWPAKADGRLNLLYAGEAAFTGAIALLFDRSFGSSESANRSIRVRTGSGEIVQGRWAVSRNPQMLLFPATPGVYHISVGPELADSAGNTVSAPSAGAVVVR